MFFSKRACRRLGVKRAYVLPCARIVVDAIFGRNVNVEGLGLIRRMMTFTFHLVLPVFCATPRPASAGRPDQSSPAQTPGHDRKADVLPAVWHRNRCRYRLR